MIAISDQFDSGNIVVIDASDPEDVALAIRPDHGSDHYQWFHFLVSGSRNTPLTLRITNAAGASYEDGWPEYQAVASYDREEWFRVQTRYERSELVIDHVPKQDHVWYAYFAPYSWERHMSLIGKHQGRRGVRAEVIGQSIDGRPLDLLVIDEGERKKVPCWIIARQHPGETMAEWLVEGLLERLLDSDDALARELRARAAFYIVPNMNPDGGVRGHLRTNAAGVNLNRAWADPTMERSPEVYATLTRMKETGVAFCLDVHGDEALPYNFIAGPDGVKGLKKSVLALVSDYKEALVGANPDFQTRYGYPVDDPGEANLTMATNQIAHQFGAVAMTLEQPFKDTTDCPYPETGWSPARAKLLGRAQLDALAAIIDRLK